jgi:hypothetical protein
VCVPGSTRRSSFSAAKIVKKYASGVRATVDKNKCPPGYKVIKNIRKRNLSRLSKMVLAYLDELSARTKKCDGIVYMFNNFHRAHHVEPLLFLNKCFCRGMSICK